MEVIATKIPDVLLIKPTVFEDGRGFFMEMWNAGRYGAHGLPDRFVQSNISRSAAGVIRGLHYQHPCAQGKLVSVLEGRAFDVAVDSRSDSPTFRQRAHVQLASVPNTWQDRRAKVTPSVICTAYACAYPDLTSTAVKLYRLPWV